MDVEFDEEPIPVPSARHTQGGTLLMSWFVKKGFAKNSTQAARLLVALIVIAVLVSIFIAAISNQGTRLTDKPVQAVPVHSQAY